MEINAMKITRITISEPYSPNEKGRCLNCTISLEGVYGAIELKLDTADIEPIVPLLAQAMANAGKAAAAGLQCWLDEVVQSAPVIEHSGKPLEIIEAAPGVDDVEAPPIHDDDVPL